MIGFPRSFSDPFSRPLTALTCCLIAGKGRFVRLRIRFFFQFLLALAILLPSPMVSATLNTAEEWPTARNAQVPVVSEDHHAQEGPMVSDTDQSAPSQKWSERQKDLFSQAFMYSMGTGGSLESFKKGVRILERQAEAGKVDACLLLGNLYSAQNGTVQNYELAIKWYRKGAARGDKDCQYFLAMKCLLGEGTQTDANKAVYWFRKAAKQGVVKAQSELGMLYYKGKGTGQNMTQAAKWLKKSSSSRKWGSPA